MRTLIRRSACVLAACSALALIGCDRAQDSATTSEGAVTSGPPAAASTDQHDVIRPA